MIRKIRFSLQEYLKSFSLKCNIEDAMFEKQ